jgi:DNA-binding response OmpR family regulator
VDANLRGLVLVIESDPAMHGVVEQAIARLDEADVIRSSVSREGIRTAHERQPDLVVVADSPPRLDGAEITRQLKGDLVAEVVPVLALTRSADRAAVLHDAGADDCLEGPFDVEQLVQSVRALMYTRRPA